jgi:transposase
MPWKASSVMEERLRFVARLLDGEAMTDVCRDFGVSRKTGYKMFDRYKEHGLEALSDRSRRPVRYANQLPEQIESLIVRLKAEKPHWGARKIRELLVRRLDGDIRVPAKSTIHAVLDRHDLVKRAGGPRHRARGTPLSAGTGPNELWCADFKGEFNTERPHEALQMKCPAELYRASPRRYDGLPELIYPFHDREVLVTACGRLCLHRKINVSTVLAGQKLGIKEVDDGIWLVSFMHYDLGYFDLEQKTLQPLDNPFGTRLSPMS